MRLLKATWARGNISPGQVVEKETVLTTDRGFRSSESGIQRAGESFWAKCGSDRASRSASRLIRADI